VTSPNDVAGPHRAAALKGPADENYYNHISGAINCMGRKAASFTQAELHRAIKAVVQSGADMAVEITKDGTIRIARNLGVSASSVGTFEAPVAPRRPIAL